MLLLSMALQSCTSNLKLDTGAAVSQPQASKKPLRRLVGGEQHPQDKPMSISAPSEKVPAVPAAAQITPATPLSTDLSPSSSPHHPAAPPFPRTVLHNPRLSQGTAITQPSKDSLKAQAMRSAQPTQRPSAPLAKDEAAGAARVQHLTASGGKEVALYQKERQWQAQVTERIGDAHRQVVLPVVCAPDCEVAALLRYEAGRVAQLLHVAKQGLDEFVYVGRQGLLGGMMPGVEEHKEEFPQEQSAPRGSLLELGLLEHQGPTAVEQAQSNIESFKEAIEEGYGLLLSLETADLQVIEKLFSDLEQWLQEEQLCVPTAGEESVQEYIIRLREDDSLNWGDHRDRLTALLARAYAQVLKRAVSTSLLKGPSNLSHEEKQRLAMALGQLAAFHQAQGSQIGDLSLYTDAAILYQHMLQVCEGEAEKVYRGLAEIKAAMIAKCKPEKATLSSRATSDELQEEIARDKQILQDLRVEAKRRVAELEAAEMSDEALYIEESKALFAEIAQRVGAFLARLYQESEDKLGPAPCKYTVMGLGSMALQQMTPYSDLEFAILMEDNESQEVLAKQREYLRQLSHLVHLRVINLGETVVPRSKYGVSLDYLGKRGINFDLGGKTPLGRSDKKYELIQPVAGMMRYLRNEGHKMEHMDKLLPFILERTCCVHGDPGLHAAYVAQKSAFFARAQTEQGIPVYQARALQKLLEGVVEMNYSKPGPGIAKPRQPGDLADFEPKFESGDEGRLYDVKQEIYRLPDRLLCRLAMYYGILPESGWDAVEQLWARGIISEAAAGHLGYAVSFATLLRLRTYLHHGEQKEEMAVLSGMRKGPTQQVVSQSFALDVAALEVGGSLFKYYYTALPLHQRMKDFFNKVKSHEQLLEEQAAVSFFQSEAFYNDDDWIKGMICTRLMQYKEGIRCYEKAIERDRAVYGDKPHPYVAMFFNNLGLAYEALGEVQQALQYQERSLDMKRAVYGDKAYPDVAATLNNVGSAHDKLGDPSKGLEYFTQAFQMRKAFYGDQAHADLAGSLTNLGVAYEKLGDVPKALLYYEQSLQMNKALYEDKAHPDLATSLGNLGNAHKALGEARKGLQYQEQALEMRQKLYGDQAHPNLALSLNNVGIAYEGLRDLHKGLEYFEQAFEMRQALYRDKAHPDLASSLMNVGVAYEELGDVQKGLMYQRQALEMRQNFYRDQTHPDLARSFMNVGVAYAALGEAKQGLAYYEQALKMYKKLYGDQAHPDLATSLNNMGSAYAALRELQKALPYFEQALKMRQALYKGKAQPDLAVSLNNLGVTYAALRDLHKGLEYFEQAFEMRQALYRDKAHPDLASSLMSLGIAYEALEEYTKAKQHYEEGLMISNKLPGEAHPYIQTFTQKLGRLVNQCYVAAIKAYAQHDVSGVIRNYEELLQILPAASRDTKRSICQDLGCMYHVAALHATEEAVRETYLNKATAAFEQVLAWRSDTVKAGLWTDYGNFLLATAQLAQAHNYLIQVIDSGDTQSELRYGLIEQATVSPLLQACIDQNEQVQIRAIDYAYYLLIFHYEEFAQAGIALAQARGTYLGSYRERIRASAGQPGKEKQDALAYFLLESLQQALGDE